MRTTTETLSQMTNLLAVVSALLIGWIVPLAWLPGVLIALLSSVVLWFSRKVPRRTMRGALEAARWQAFRAHLMEEPAATRTLCAALLGIWHRASATAGPMTPENGSMRPPASRSATGGSPSLI